MNQITKDYQKRILKTYCLIFPRPMRVCPAAAEAEATPAAAEEAEAAATATAAVEINLLHSVFLGYHGFVSLLKGLHTSGKTLEEVKKNLKEAIRCHLRGLVKDRTAIPREENAYEVRFMNSRHVWLSVSGICLTF